MDFSFLHAINHRPYPMPTRSWAMRMVWHDLLFAHWPVPAETLQSLIPDGLELDTFDGTAWLGVVPFGMRDVNPRGLPDIPLVSRFLELNVRTYVRANGRAGVWFFSLDAQNPLAVRGARMAFYLPYMDARMKLKREAGWITYSSERTHRNEPPASFSARYQPVSDVYTSRPGTLEHWLTERYCLYSTNRTGRIYRGEIHHAPWRLQRAEAVFERNTMTNSLGFNLEGAPTHLHFAHELLVVAWLLEPI
jgi:hypothetical protein